MSCKEWLFRKWKQLRIHLNVQAINVSLVPKKSNCNLVYKTFFLIKIVIMVFEKIRRRHFIYKILNYLLLYRFFLFLSYIPASFFCPPILLFVLFILCESIIYRKERGNSNFHHCFNCLQVVSAENWWNDFERHFCVQLLWPWIWTLVNLQIGYTIIWCEINSEMRCTFLGFIF